LRQSLSFVETKYQELSTKEHHSLAHIDVTRICKPPGGDAGRFQLKVVDSTSEQDLH
jgi:hypothetical protein